MNGEHPKSDAVTSNDRTYCRCGALESTEHGCEVTYRAMKVERDRLRAALGDAQKQLGALAVLVLQNDRDETLEWARGVKVTFPNGEPMVAVESPHETADDPLEHSKVILDEILAERGRQVTRLGWTPQHDDEHDDRSLARAAATYVLHYTHRAVFAKSDPSAYQEEAGAMDAACWPDGWEFKPKSPHRDLIRAAALIVAELERLDRSSSQKADDGLVKRGGAIDSSEHKR